MHFRSLHIKKNLWETSLPFIFFNLSNMNNIIKSAIEQGFNGIAVDNTIRSLYTNGWLEGYKWILTELSVRGHISNEVVKHYMDALN